MSLLHVTNVKKTIIYDMSKNKKINFFAMIC